MAKRLARSDIEPTGVVHPVARVKKVAAAAAVKPTKGAEIAATTSASSVAPRSASQIPDLVKLAAEFSTNVFNLVCFPDDNRPSRGPVIGPTLNTNGVDPHIAVSSSFIDPLDNEEKITKYEFRFNPNLDRPKRASIPVIGGINLVELVCPKESNEWTPEALRANQGAVRGVLAYDPNLNPRHRQAEAKADNAEKAKLQLEFFQKEAVAAGLRAITTGGQSITNIEMPTGTGKTLVAWSLMHEHLQQLRDAGKPTGSVVFVVNSLPILKDAEKKLITFFPEYANGIRRCYKSTDALPHGISANKIYFTTPKGLLNLLPVLVKRGEKISHAIYDEVHHIVADEHNLSLVSLKDDHRDVKVVGYSATPFRTDQRSVTKHAGESAYSYSQLEAWRDGYLPTVRITRPSMPVPKEKFPDGVPKDVVDLGSKIISYKNILDRYIEAKASLYNGKTLILVNTTDEADKLAEFLNDHRVKAAVYHSKAANSYQDYLRWNDSNLTKDTPDVLITVDALKEGVDARPAHLMICKSVKSFPSLVQIIGRGTRVDEGKTHLLVSDMAGVTHNSGFLLTIMNYFKMIHKQDSLTVNDFDKGYMNYCHELMGSEGDELDLEMFKLDSTIADNIRSYISQEPEYLAKAYGSYESILKLEAKPQMKELKILDRYIARRLKLSGNIDHCLEEYFKALRVDLDAGRHMNSADAADRLVRRREELINVLAPGITDDEGSVYDFLKITSARKIVFKRLLTLLELQTENEFRKHLIRDLGQVLPEFAHKLELKLEKARINMKTLRNSLCPGLDDDELFSQYLTNHDFIKSLSSSSRRVMHDIKLLVGTYPDHPWFKFMGASKDSQGTAPLTWPGGDEQHCIRALYEAYCKIAVIRKSAAHEKLNLSECLNSSPHISFGLGAKLKVNDIYDARSRFEMKLEELGLHKREDNPLDELPTQIHSLADTHEPDRIITNIRRLLARCSNDDKMLGLSDRIILRYRTTYSKLAAALKLHMSSDEYEPILSRFAELIEKGSILDSFTHGSANYELRKALQDIARFTDAKFSKLRLCRKPNAEESSTNTELSSILLSLSVVAGQLPGYKFMTLQPSSAPELSCIEADYQAITNPELRQEFLNNIVSGLVKVQGLIKDNKLIFVIPPDRLNSSFFRDLQESIFKNPELDVMGPFCDKDSKLPLDDKHYRLSAFSSVDQRKRLLDRQDVTKSRVLAAICDLFVRLNPELKVESFPTLKAAMEAQVKISSLPLRLIKQCFDGGTLKRTDAKKEILTALSVIEKHASQLAQRASLDEQDLTVLGLGLLAERRKQKILTKGISTEIWFNAVDSLLKLYIQLKISSDPSTQVTLTELVDIINELSKQSFTTERGSISINAKNLTGFGNAIGTTPGQIAVSSATRFILKHNALLQTSTATAAAITTPVVNANPLNPKTIYIDTQFNEVSVWLSDVHLTGKGTSAKVDPVKTAKLKPVVHLNPECSLFKTADKSKIIRVFHDSVESLNRNFGRGKTCNPCPECCDTSSMPLVDYLAGLQEKYNRSLKGETSGFNFVAMPS